MADLPDLDESDLLRRVTRCARVERPGATLAPLRPLEGGVSSLTFATSLRSPGVPDEPLVLKVAPPGLAPVRNRDVLRQARALDALAGIADFPVPAVRLAEDGEPPWFAMRLVAGESYEPLLDVTPTPPDAVTVAARMHAAARALAHFHEAAPRRVGGLGEAPVSVADELERWSRLFATVDEDIAPGHEKLHARLAERLPVDVDPVLVHGDFRLANMLFTGPRLEAVIDWEIWSVGDPRIDLAWLLMHAAPAHVFHEDRSPADVAAGALVPTGAELLATYRAARRGSGAEQAALAATTAELEWFLALSFYKTASTTAVIIKRDRKRDRPQPKLAVAARHLGGVLAAGHAALDG